MNAKLDNSSDTKQSVKSLAAKMARVMAQISRVPKNGHNKFQNYNYATHGDAIDVVRPLLAAEGVALFFDVLDIVDVDNGRTRVQVAYTLVDGDSGESAETICWGEARDVDRSGNTLDKGIYKAITGASKYWLFQTFMMSTGDDPEDSQEQQAKSPANPNLISSAQQQRLYAILTESGLSPEQGKEILRGHGFASSKDITRDAYDKVVAAIQAKGKQVAKDQTVDVAVESQSVKG